MQSTWQICQFELTRLFLTKRGGILLTAFAVIWFIIFKYPVFEAVKIVSNPAFGDNVNVFSDQLNLRHLMTWPYSELAIYWLFAVMAFPITAVLMSSDQLASDANRGTLRFLLLRCSRHQLLFGRFFGQLLIVSILIGLTLFAALTMAVVRDGSLLLSTFDQLGFIAINLVILCLPFIALTSLLNIVLKSSKLSIVMIIIIIPIFNGIISYLSLYIAPIDNLLLLLPGIQLIDTLQMPAFDAAAPILTPLLQTVGYLALAQFILTRRAL